jgi:hypothetical protein
MNTFLSLILAVTYPLLPASVNDKEEPRLLLELHTAAVCFIKDGHNARSIVGGLYNYLDRAEISHPDPTSELGKTYWQLALARATPQKCQELRSLSSDLSNI